MDQKNDQELIDSYMEGDSQSLEFLIRRHLSSTYNFVARFTGDLHEAHDITQETFLKVWKHIKKFDKTKSFKTWIFTIARNTSLDWFRKRKPISFSKLNSFSDDGEDFDVPDESIISSEEIFDKSKDAERISEILKTLPALQQTIVAMKINEGLTFQEISEILDEPLNTVKSRYRRALVILKEKMNAPNGLQ